MLSEEMKSVFQVLKQVKALNEGNGIPAEIIPKIRKENTKMADRFPIPKDISFEEKIIGGIAGEYYTFNNNDPEKLADKFLIYIHGGGFQTGSTQTARFIAATLAHDTKIDGFSIEYSQWPEVKHPTALNECLQVYRAVIQKYKPENVYIAGESAGAVLSLTLALYLRDHGEPLPSKVIACGPVIDFSDNPESRYTRAERDPMLSAAVNQQIRYFTDEQRKSPYVSVRYADFSGFPKTLITVGTEEVLYDDAIILHEMLDKAGVENELIIYEGLFHTFQTIPAPESFESIRTMSEFLRKNN